MHVGNSVLRGHRACDLGFRSITTPPHERDRLPAANGGNGFGSVCGSLRRSVDVASADQRTRRQATS